MLALAVLALAVLALAVLALAVLVAVCIADQIAGSRAMDLRSAHNCSRERTM